MSMMFCYIKAYIADIFTKARSREYFEKNRFRLEDD